MTALARTVTVPPAEGDPEAGLALLGRLRTLSGGQSYADDAEALAKAAPAAEVFRPVPAPRAGKPAARQPFVLLIDNSASMAATDVAPHRLAAAKKAALRQLAAEKDNAPGIVLAFSSDVEVLQTLTTDRDLLHRAVEGVSQTQRPTRLEPALELIGALTGPHPVHLFSDGGFPDVGDLDFDPPALHTTGSARRKARPTTSGSSP